MPSQSFEIRICDSCGLRYPITSGQQHGERCPVCMGQTRVILSRQLASELTRDIPDSFHRKEGRKSLAVLLDNIRSGWNVGSILRSADGFGFEHAYLCGITPTPESEAVTKTSLGAEDMVTWSHHKDAVKLVKGLKKEGWVVIALEDDERAAPLRKEEMDNNNVVLIMGNEVCGVDPELINLCDAIYYIPMYGKKKSFNVAIAFSIAAYAMQ